MASMQVGLPQCKVYAKMKNHTSTEMLCERYINFTEIPSPGVLPPIPAGERLDLDQVVWKGAVIYSGYNKDKKPSAWLLAWDAPVINGIQAPSKVYVACGSKNVIKKMSPEEIQKNLDDASNTSVATDLITKTTANAKILVLWPMYNAYVSADFALVN